MPAPHLFVATRKGLFHLPVPAAGASWAVRPPAFLGEPVSMVLPDPATGRLWAALNLGHFGTKLWGSDDLGASWEEVESPRFPAIVENGASGDGAPAEAAPGAEPSTDETSGATTAAAAPSVSQIWSLEADGRGGLWAGTLPGGLFHSTDGRSWTLNAPLWECPERALWFGGGYPDPGIHSIAVHPDDPNDVLVGVSCGGVWRSRDAGASWTLSATGMRAEYMPPDQAYDPRTQDPHRLVACPARPDTLWVQHHNGIFTSGDRAASWTEVKKPAVSGFGFAVAVHPEHPDEAWFVPAVKDECRVPVDGRLVVTHTTDGGASFDTFSDGLPAGPCYDLIYRHALDISADGTHLAFGSTSGNLWYSNTGGRSWQTISTHLPPIYAVRFATL